jgi:hypothetical protein
MNYRNIFRYDLLMQEHLPMFHPEVMSDGIVDLEEIPYEVGLIGEDHF